MASRKTKPSKKAAPKKKTKPAVKAPVRTTAAPSAKPQGASALLVALPALTAVQRDAFEEQFDDADCMEAGEGTKSLAVRNCALAWVAEAKDAVTSVPNIDYGPERLAWIVELVAQLDVARAGQSGQGTSKHGVRTTRDVARDKARELRGRVLSKLGRALTSKSADRAAYDAAHADARTDDELATSLESVAALIDDLVGRGDQATSARLASQRVVAADADAARAAAEALTGATDDVTLGGRARGDRDTPAVNLVEGRVLKELGLLSHALANARDRGVPVPALVVPNGLRAALGKRVRGTGGGDEPGPPGAPPGGGGAKTT